MKVIIKFSFSVINSLRRSQAVVIVPVLTLCLLWLLPLAISVIPVVVEVICEADLLSIRRPKSLATLVTATNTEIAKRLHLIQAQAKCW